VQLVGGYKAFRNWALDQLVVPQQVRLLGGKTGSGKTEYLHFLAKNDEQIIDLEARARHKGSVFGGDKDKQATQQQFENDLAIQWAFLNKNLPVWIEDESRKIGSVIIPESIWLQMQQAPFYFLLARRKDRIVRIVYEYGFLDKNFLLHALAEIKEHLGLERYQIIKSYIEQYEYRQAFEMLLDYYDKKYTYGLSRKKIEHVRAPIHYFL
jgi:tRNA 2-selenouridine synthase